MNLDDEPTQLTASDIDKFVESIMNSEIQTHACGKCAKTYIHDSYGHHIGECDECWFSRFPKEEVGRFYRSFFE